MIRLALILASVGFVVAFFALYSGAMWDAARWEAESLGADPSTVRRGPLAFCDAGVWSFEADGPRGKLMMCIAPVGRLVDHT